MGLYGDLRDRMHPGIAKTVPNTPEALAVVNGSRFKEITFGDLATQLVEQGAVAAEDSGNITEGLATTLGIRIEEVKDGLTHTGIISEYNADRMSRSYEERAEKKIKRDKFNAVAAHFSETIEGQIVDPNSDILGSLTEQQRRLVGELQQKGDGASMRDFYLVEKPKLEAMEDSNFIISPSRLADILRGDPLLGENGDEFAKTVIKRFSEILGRLKVLPYKDSFYRLFTGEEVRPEELEAFEKPNIIEYLAAKKLAEVYTTHYFEYEQPGSPEIEDIDNPVHDAFFVSREQEEAFFEVFPLAKAS